MSTKVFFSLDAIPGVSIWLTRNGHEYHPMDTGRVGPFLLTDDIRINLSVSGKHTCFTINPKNHSEQISLPEIGASTYEKKINMSLLEGAGHISSWPKNMVCLEINNQRYNIGIADQKGIFYFVIEVPGKDDPNLIYSKGKVRWYLPLRGYGAICTDDPFIDARIHWTALPRRDNGFRYLVTGEEVTWTENNVLQTTSNDSFAFEITKAQLVIS